MGLRQRLLSGTAAGRTRRNERYECLNCRERFDLQFHVCPDCGGFSIERTEWDLV